MERARERDLDDLCPISPTNADLIPFPLRVELLSMPQCYQTHQHINHQAIIYIL